MRLLKEPPYVVLGRPAILLSRRQWATWVLGLAVLGFLLAPWSLYDKLWAIAYGICPQRPEHSLFFGGVQMPIEAREGGMFGGFLLGVIYLIVIGRGRAWRLPSRKILAVLLGFIAIMGLDGINAVAYDLYFPTPYAPNLYLRMGTGLLTGLALAGILLPIFNQSIWQQRNGTVTISSWRDLLPALLLFAAMWLTGLSGWKLFLYPISILAIFGQVILMVSLAVMTASIIFRREGQVRNFTELAPLILVALIIVAAGLGMTSAVRFSLFGPGSIPAIR
jgi:uncharacterized membrane protein